MPERTPADEPRPAEGGPSDAPSTRPSGAWATAGPSADAGGSWAAFDSPGSWGSFASGGALASGGGALAPAAAGPLGASGFAGPSRPAAAFDELDAAREPARRLSAAMRLVLARAPRAVARRVRLMRAAAAGAAIPASPLARSAGGGRRGGGGRTAEAGRRTGTGGLGGGGGSLPPGRGDRRRELERERGRRRERGRGATVAWLSAAVVGAGALAFAAGLAIAPWSVRAGVDATALPASAVPGGRHASTLPAGACVAAFDSAWQARFEPVDCAGPHAAQLVGVVAIEAAAYPGADALAREAQLRCQAPDVLAIDRAELLADVVVDVSYPVSAAEWDAGDREYRCFVARASGRPIEGSLAAAG